MPTIRQLPSDLINKIAAGEVVERPASVVKELVENALDAGATRVEVELVGGGRELIQVADDGRGMSREDALLSIERHATSKLVDAEGLFHIASFGFRGEAIPAIASVSRMSLTTREPDALEGTRIEIEGGAIRAAEPCGAPRGTTLAIRDLFFATPARRKFLKRPETEAGHASEALVRLALARPDVAFTLRSGGRAAFQSPASEDPRERIAAALGKEIFEHLLPVEHARGTLQVRGFAASPAFSAPTGRAIYTYVNGRYIRDRQLLHAIQRAYDGLLPQGRSPGLVIFIDLPPGEVDVNVHPQKQEVRFAEPRVVYDALLRGLSDALGKGDWLGSTNPAVSPAARVRSFAVPPSSQPAFDWQARYRSAGRGAPIQGGDGAGIREAASALWPRRGDPVAAGRGMDPASGASTLSEVVSRTDAHGVRSTEGGLSTLRVIGALGPSFLLCESPSGGLVILDPHPLRERIALAELGGASGGRQGQPFLFPVILDPGIANGRLLLRHVEVLRELGIDLEPFGGTTFALKEVPRVLVGVDYEALAADLVDACEAAAEGQRRGAALAVMACRAGANQQTILTVKEAQELVDTWDRIEAGGAALHDNPFVVELSLDELHKKAGAR